VQANEIVVRVAVNARSHLVHRCDPLGVLNGAFSALIRSNATLILLAVARVGSGAAVVQSWLGAFVKMTLPVELLARGQATKHCGLVAVVHSEVNRCQVLAVGVLRILTVH
jgi:hypothetical protein